MRNRLIAFAGSFALATGAIWLQPLAAQSPAAAKPSGQVTAAKPAAQRWVAPRTADGVPDLQGVYNVATITPLERPVGAKPVLTNEEAAAVEKYEEERGEKNNAPSNPDRTAPPVGGSRATGKTFLEFLEFAGGGAVGGYNNFWLSGGTKVITVNGEKRSSIVVDPPDGRVPRIKPEAGRRNAILNANAVAPDANEATAAAAPPGAYDGPELRPLAERCLLGFGSTSGPPTLPNYFYNNLKQIVQTKNTIMILNEMVHDVRIIRMNAKHQPPHIRSWMGDSVGHWEGDTLVVDTTNFTNKTRFNGSGDQLHVIERFTRVAPNTILYRFTIDDPSTWDRTWTGEYPWIATDEPLYEYACHEGNYSLGGILRGARLQDAENAKKQGASR